MYIIFNEHDGVLEIGECPGPPEKLDVKNSFGKFRKLKILENTEKQKQQL